MASVKDTAQQFFDACESAFAVFRGTYGRGRAHCADREAGRG
jgi:hypothetical protein